MPSIAALLLVSSAVLATVSARPEKVSADFTAGELLAGPIEASGTGQEWEAATQQQQQQQFYYPAQARQDSPGFHAGPWVTVPINQGLQGVRDQGFGINAAVGLNTQNILTWGLGAVVLILIATAGFKVFKQLVPSVKDMIEEIEETGVSPRSLETMTSAAQFAMEAIEKYNKMNDGGKSKEE